MSDQASPGVERLLRSLRIGWPVCYRTDSGWVVAQYRGIDNAHGLYRRRYGMTEEQAARCIVRWGKDATPHPGDPV